MYLQLQPGLLSNTPKTEPDDQLHKMVINHSIVPLSPKEYALATALLRQRVLWREAGGQALLCLSVGQLMQATGIQPQGALVRHLSNASMKLAPQGIYLVNVRTYGYIALFEAEVVGSFLAFSIAEDLPHNRDEAIRHTAQLRLRQARPVLRGKKGMLERRPSRSAMLGRNLATYRHS